MRAALPLTAIVATALLALSGCDRMRGGSTPSPRQGHVPADQTMNMIPLGSPPGEPISIATDIRNPYEGDAAAVTEGKALFSSMNCVYCHGAQGAGLMAPPLDTPAWRYGGTPAEIYNSIHDGRPKGMPAWGGRLPPDQIWRLVAYIESLGGASPPATANTAALGPKSSTTGPEPAGEVQTDTAHESLQRADQGQGH